MFNINKYVFYGIAILLLALSLIGTYAYWKHKIQIEERQKIEQQLKEDALKKSLEAEKNAKEIQKELMELTPSELAEYFRTGKLPNRLKNRYAPDTRSASPENNDSGQK